ncbi:Aspartate/glutamate/uridylate kinase [Mucidula mucida]|nr:Aspartate/glutamate/uridylate kinase [Mucidula mucida]
MARPRHSPPCTVVIKLGSSSIVHEKTHQPLLSTLSSVVETVVQLRAQGHKVVLVSSGAIAVGLQRMNLPSRPKSLSGSRYGRVYSQSRSGLSSRVMGRLFRHLGQPIAQRTRYLNAVNTFKELLSMGVVPIVNENDTVSVSEIKFGDNDTLSAITSSMIHADYLFLLTDVDGLYTSNPRKDPNAKHIDVVTSISAIREQVSTTTLGSSLGTGGMETKIIAAEIATGAGVTTIVTSSKCPQDIFGIIEYHNSQRASSNPGTPAEPGGPILMPSHHYHERDLKSWTSHTLFPSGSVIIDSESGGRLLAAGVLGVLGAFASGQAVRIVILKSSENHEEPAGMQSLGSTRPGTPSILAASSISSSVASLEPLSRSDSSTDVAGKSLPSLPEGELVSGNIYDESDVTEVGRGLANYNSAQIMKIKGLNSSYIPQLLGYADSEYVVENITIRVPP